MATVANKNKANTSPANNNLNNLLNNNNTFNNTSQNTGKNTGNNKAAGIFSSLPSKNNIANKVSNVAGAVSNKVSNVAGTVSNKVSNVVETVQDKIENIVEAKDDLFSTVLKISVIILVLVAIFYILRYLFIKYQANLVEAPYLLEGIKNAKHALVISQDPNNAGYVPMPKSDGQAGIQFTYSYWMMIDGYDYNAGKWKHVFHKGDQNSYPNRAPGVWLHPNTNSMRVYMNTQTNILEYVDISNLPVRKWIHVAVILDDTNLDVYINGFLKTRHKLSSVPKLNTGDFWCNMYGGFDGFVSRIRYYARAISPEELTNIVKDGPGSGACIGTDEVPPYLDDDWWLE